MIGGQFLKTELGVGNLVKENMNLGTQERSQEQGDIKLRLI